MGVLHNQGRTESGKLAPRVSDSDISQELAEVSGDLRNPQKSPTEFLIYTKMGVILKKFTWILLQTLGLSIYCTALPSLWISKSYSSISLWPTLT